MEWPIQFTFPASPSQFWVWFLHFGYFLMLLYLCVLHTVALWRGRR